MKVYPIVKCEKVYCPFFKDEDGPFYNYCDHVDAVDNEDIVGEWQDSGIGRYPDQW